MTSTFWIYSAAAFFTAFSGGVLPLFFAVNEKYLKLIIALGAGLLLGLSMVHLLPESAELIPESFGAWFLVGFVLLLVLERFVMIHACEEHGCNYHTVVIAAFVGLTIHGVIEGLALASTLVTLEIGPLVLMAVLVHKAPAALTLTSLLRLGGKKKIDIIRFITGISIATPLGILIGANVIEADTYTDVSGILLALSGGTFLYIASCDLLPELHRSNSEKFKRLAAFMLGVVISFWGH